MSESHRKIWEHGAPLPTMAECEPPPELLRVAATVPNEYAMSMRRKVGWPSYVGYVGVGLGGELSRQTLARFSSTLGEPGACEFASVFAAQNLASLSSPQQAAAVEFLQRLLLTHDGVSILVQVAVHLHAADRLFCHAMDVYGERDGEVHGPWWAVKHLLFMILSVMVRNGMCAAPVIREGRHCCAPPRFRSSQCLISFEHTPSRQERWFSLHPCIHWLCAECCDTLLEETDWVCPLCGTDVTTAVSLVTVGLAATTQPTLGTRPRTPPPTSGDEETHSPSLRNEADETQETEMAWSEHGSPERGSPGAPRI